MGTDIHAVFQAKRNGKWEDIPSKYEQERHYYLFSVLAGVRNGFGFAGVKTYEPVKPISEPRGLPEDFAMEYYEEHRVSGPEMLTEWRQKYAEADLKEKGYLTVWMGDHSYSWVTAEEVLKYAEKAAEGSTLRTGVVDLEYYKKWDQTKAPESYCGGISGRDVVVSLPSDIGHKTTHVQVVWYENNVEPIQYFVDEMKRLKDEHGEVRMVFGFDS